MPKSERSAKLTKRSVEAAAPNAERDTFLWDTDVKGFGLRVLPSGVKSYVFRYRTAEGRRRLATIGQHGGQSAGGDGTWTADKARDAAAAMWEARRAGRDPLKERRELRSAQTVAELLDAYADSPRFKEKATSTQAIDSGRIARHLKPLLGREHVHKLARRDVERALASIRDGKTAADVMTGKPRGRARVLGGAGTAIGAIALLRAAFNWAVSEGLATRNPCAHVQLAGSGTRDAILEDADAHKRLFSTLDRMEREKRIRPGVADAIRLIALTGARRGEVSELRWRHVDLKRGTITLPPGTHKTGRRTGKPRVIGLPAVAQAIIARQPKGQPDAFVFERRQGSLASSLSHAWRRRLRRKDGSVLWKGVAVEAELPEAIGLHGLRHTVGSHLAMAGAAAPEIMTVLGHRQLSTVQRYIHFAEQARSTLSERAAAVAIAGMAASERDEGEGEGEIVPLMGAER